MDSEVRKFLGKHCQNRHVPAAGGGGCLYRSTISLCRLPRPRASQPSVRGRLPDTWVEHTPHPQILLEAVLRYFARLSHAWVQRGKAPYNLPNQGTRNNARVRDPVNDPRPSPRFVRRGACMCPSPKRAGAALSRWSLAPILALGLFERDWRRGSLGMESPSATLKTKSLTQACRSAGVPSSPQAHHPSWYN